MSIRKKNSSKNINIKFDIIIDDGSHQISDQQITFGNFFHLLNSSGLYVIEDIYPQHNYPEEFKSLFKVHDLRYIKNRGDDIIFEYKK